jgi:hypothetical protein
LDDARTRPLEQERWNRITYEFDDSQIDAHGFAAFRSHNFACLPSFSTNFPPDPLVLIKGLGGSGIVEQEWPVFDLKGYWKVRALRDGVLKLAMGDETPRAGLGKGETRKGKPGYMARICWCALGLTKSEMTMSLTRRFAIVWGGDGKVEWNSEGEEVREGMYFGEVFKVAGEGEEREAEWERKKMEYVWGGACL